MPLKIMIVDDHEIVRVGIKELLSHYPKFEIVAEAGNADDAMRVFRISRPDVILMDIRMPGKNGIELTKEIMAYDQNVKIIILTSFLQDDLLFEAETAGAFGYVLKQLGNDDLIDTLHRVQRDKEPLNASSIQAKLENYVKENFFPENEILQSLTTQELKILIFLPLGKTNKEIAKEMDLSEKTVRNYVSSILCKLDASSRTEAAAFAAKHKLDSKLQTLK